MRVPQRAKGDGRIEAPAGLRGAVPRASRACAKRKVTGNYMKAIKLNSINQGPGVGVVMTEKEARILAFHLMYSLVWSDQEDKYPGSGNVLRELLAALKICSY